VLSSSCSIAASGSFATQLECGGWRVQTKRLTGACTRCLWLVEQLGSEKEGVSITTSKRWKYNAMREPITAMRCLRAEPKRSNPRSTEALLATGLRQARDKRRYCCRICDRRARPVGVWIKASWRQRNRRASIHLSPLASVPSAILLTGSISSIPPLARHVNPPVPPLKIPRSAWHSVVQRVAQGESLRSIARSLDTSYEAVRRVLLAARQDMLGDPDEPPPLSDEDVG